MRASTPKRTRTALAGPSLSSRAAGKQWERSASSAVVRVNINVGSMGNGNNMNTTVGDTTNPTLLRLAADATSAQIQLEAERRKNERLSEAVR